MSFVALNRGWDAPLSHILNNEPFCARMAWHWIIENAAYATHDRQGAAGHARVDRGQLAFSYNSLATAWGWDRFKVRRFIGHIEKAGAIKTYRFGRQQVLTVIGYDGYLAGGNIARTA